MFQSLYLYLIEAYTDYQNPSMQKMTNKPFIQIDDQDDHDDITEFVNIFVIPKRRYTFELELLGPIPITQEMVDLAQIYHGKVNYSLCRLTLSLNPKLMKVVLELAALIRKSSSLGETVQNVHWKQISTRTISSLYRLDRIMQDFISLKESQLI